jgi:hypothetical protein
MAAQIDRQVSGNELRGLVGRTRLWADIRCPDRVALKLVDGTGPDQNTASESRILKRHREQARRSVKGADCS